MRFFERGETGGGIARGTSITGDRWTKGRLAGRGLGTEVLGISASSCGHPLRMNWERIHWLLMAIILIVFVEYTIFIFGETTRIVRDMFGVSPDFILGEGI